MKRLFVLLLSLALVLNLVGCSNDTESTAPTAGGDDSKYGGTLTVGVIADPDSLNPLISTDTIGAWILENQYPSLLVMDEDANKVPYLAESVQTSEDGLTVTVKIKEGLTWSDGTPLTSKDVKYSGEVLHEQNLKYGNLFEGVTIECPDDYTVIYNLSQPNAIFITKYGFWCRVVPEHIFSQYEDQKQFLNEDPVVCGPFQLTDFEKGQYYTLEAVESCGLVPDGRERAYLDKIVYRVYPDANTMALALVSGEIDVTGIPISHSLAEEFEEKEGITVETVTSLGYAYLGYNLRNDILSDVRVREALSYAIDREQIVEVGLEGDGFVLDTPVNPQWKNIYNEDAKLSGYNPEKAKKILTDAGYVDTDGDGILNDSNGNNLVFEVKYPGNYVYLKNAAEIILANMQEVGISIVLKPIEKATWSQDVFRQNNFDLSLGKWGIIDPLNDSLFALFNSTNDTEMGLNFMGYHSDKIDELTQAVRDAVTIEEQIEAIKEAQNVFVEEQPVLPLFVQKYKFAYSNDFEGWVVYPSDLKGIMDVTCLVNVFEK